MRIEKPFHEGELRVQERAGVSAEGERNSSMITDTIIKGALRFIEQQNMVVLGSLDRDNNVWASILSGQTGFMMAATEQRVTFDLARITHNNDDPLWNNIENHSQIGMLVIDFGTRRRLRINGRIRVSDQQRLELKVQETYPNCPKYIQRRHSTISKKATRAGNAQKRQGKSLGEEQRAIITRADTFFVASAHTDRGVDVSHRGGNPGFVRILDNLTLRIPDYAGNSMFNTLGNFAVNPRAGLIFIDFNSGTSLQLIGRAETLWDQDDPDQETAGSKRFWQLHIESWLQIERAHNLQWSFLDYSSYNPSLNDEKTR